MEDSNKKGAKNAALKILSSRWRSEKEIEKKLLEKGFSMEEIEETIIWLKELGYIDDEKFGFQWAKYRIENRSYGLIRISYDLKGKGVNKKTIEAVIDKLRDEFNLHEVAMLAAQRKARGLQKSAASLRKLYGYLMRKGFPPEIIMDVMDEIEWA